MGGTLDVDVAIIGAGPAGSALAALLASRGRTVALIDRDRFPRDKICGEFLSYDALPVMDLLGAMPEIDSAGAPHIDRCRIAGSRRIQEIPFPHPARGVSRLLLDDVLLRLAGRRGATRFDGWDAIRLDVRASTVAIGREGEQRLIAARVLVGAWGRWGRFDTQLGRAFVRDRRHRHFGFKRHYRAVSGVPTSAIELHSFDDGYLGVNAIEGDRDNLCGLVHADRLAALKGRWDAFVEQIRVERPRLDDLYARHEPVQDGFLSSEPVIFRARSAIERGVVLVGDASGIVDPLAGNGMAMALQSALLAAPRILGLLDRPRDRLAIEREYVATHAAFFRPRIRWSRTAAFLLSRPALLDAALTAVRGQGVGEFLLARTRTSREEVLRLAEHWG